MLSQSTEQLYIAFTNQLLISNRSRRRNVEVFGKKNLINSIPLHFLLLLLSFMMCGNLFISVYIWHWILCRRLCCTKLWGKKTRMHVKWPVLPHITMICVQVAWRTDYILFVSFLFFVSRSFLVTKSGRSISGVRTNCSIFGSISKEMMKRTPIVLILTALYLYKHTIHVLYYVSPPHWCKIE